MEPSSTLIVGAPPLVKIWFAAMVVMSDVRVRAPQEAWCADETKVPRWCGHMIVGERPLGEQSKKEGVERRTEEDHGDIRPM
jgi:hypothetical protein